MSGLVLGMRGLLQVSVRGLRDEVWRGGEVRGEDRIYPRVETPATTSL